MKRIIQFLTVAIGLFVFAQNAQASHVAGGDLQYQCIGQDSFLVTLNLFRDCSGIGAPTAVTLTFNSTCGQNFTQGLTLQNPGGTEVSQLCPTAINNSTCNGGSLPGMQQYIYEAIVVITPPCNTWTMSYSLNARNASVNVTNSSSLNFYVEATMNSVTDNCNNSPAFTSQPIPYVCANQSVNYNYGVTEPDGDSLVFSISSGFSAQNTPLPYNTPTYTATAPIPGITIDPVNGQLTFTPGATLGNFIVVVRVDEYDPVTGQLLGTVYRDIQFVVQTCSNVIPELDAPGISNFTGTGLQIDSNSVEVCVGQSFSFDIVFSDADQADSVFLTSNIAQVLPGATVSIVDGNPAVLSVAWTAQPNLGNFLAFAVTAVDDACNVSGLLTVVFDITIVPSTYAGPDKTICQGTQSATLSATGGTIFTWNVISGDPISIGNNFSCNPCQNPVASPSVTTTYQVISNLSGTCVNVDTVTVFVAPDFTLTLPPDTLICSIQDFQLYANTSQPQFTYTYNWSPSSTLTQNNISNPVANPVTPTTYNVTVSSAQGCVKTDDVTINLSPPFPANIQVGPTDINDTTLCLGESADLEVNLGKVIPFSCGPSQTTCSSANTDEYTSGLGQLTFASGFSYPAPYGNSNQGARHQLLYTAAELQALGMSAGTITSIAFDVVTLTSVTQYQNYEVKIGCTSATTLSTGWQQNLTQVVQPYTHTTTTGWNTHTFDTPYDWDGTSNLVVEVCFQNPTNAFGQNTRTAYNNVGAAMTRFYSANVSNVCTSGSGFTSFNRPNLRFGICSSADPAAYTFQWTPNSNISNDTVQNPTVNPAVPTTYTVYIADTVGGCIDTIEQYINVVTQYDAGFFFDDPLCVNGLVDTAAPVIAGGTWTGLGISDTALGIFDPALVGIGTWPVTYTILGNCANDSTINVEVIPLPDATITSPDEFCITGGPYQLTAATAGGTWSGVGVTDPVAGTYDPAVAGLGTHQLVYTLTQPCISRDTMMVKHIQPYNPEISQVNFNICASDTIQLNYTVATGGNFGTGPFNVTWSGPGIIDPVNGLFDATAVGAGQHTVTLTVSEPNNTCGGSDNYTLTVYPLPDAGFSTRTRCENVTTNDPILANTPAIGTFDINPIPPTTVVFNPNNVIPANIGTGSWLVTYTIAADANGCANTFTDTFRIAETPPTPTPDSLNFCTGYDLLLSVQAEDADSVIWYNNSTVVRPDDSIATGTPYNAGVAPNPLDSSVTVWVTESRFGCESAPYRWDLPIRPSPTAAFNLTYTDSNGIGQTVDNISSQFNPTPVAGEAPFGVQFAATNPGANDLFYWNFWNGCNQNENGSCGCPAISEPEFDANGNLIESTNQPVSGFVYQCSGVYDVLLIQTNEYGCSDTAYGNVDVTGEVNIPNVFTPNGDGVNDIFQVIYTGLRDYQVTIFNRWGREVYSWGDVNSGWDGKINGEPAADGVYFWVLEGKTTTEQEISEKGNVTLIGSGQ